MLELRVLTDTNLVHLRQLLGRWRTAAVQFETASRVLLKAASSS
jgi:hypothetical protein